MAASSESYYHVLIDRFPWKVTTGEELVCEGRVCITVKAEELIGAKRAEGSLRVSVCYFHSIHRAFKFLHFDCTSEADCAGIHEWVHATAYVGSAPRSIAVLVNPVGGRKRGRRYWAKLMEPVFTYASFSFTLFETTSADYVEKFCRSLEVQKFTDIVCVGGDGLLHQLINGLAKRPDSQEALRMRIGVVPAGSQNALACAIGCKNPVLSLFHILKQNAFPGRILRISLDGSQELLSCCGLAWGVVSTIARRAQQLRKFGAARYAVCALKQMLSPWQAYRGLVEVREDPESAWEAVSGPFTLITSTKHSCPSSLSSEELFPGGNVSDAEVCFLSMKAKGRLATLKFLLELRKQGQHVQLPYVQTCKTRQMRISEVSVSDFNIDGEVYSAQTAEVSVFPTEIWYMGESNK